MKYKMTKTVKPSEVYTNPVDKIANVLSGYTVVDFRPVAANEAFLSKGGHVRPQIDPDVFYDGGPRFILKKIVSVFDVWE